GNAVELDIVEPGPELLDPLPYGGVRHPHGWRLHVENSLHAFVQADELGAPASHDDYGDRGGFDVEAEACVVGKTKHVADRRLDHIRMADEDNTGIRVFASDITHARHDSHAHMLHAFASGRCGCRTLLVPAPPLRIVVQFGKGLAGPGAEIDLVQVLAHLDGSD